MTMQNEVIDQKPQISIIIPVYNAELYLARCFDSIISQTFGNYEVILVDDGSTDHSGKVCDEFAAIDSRFKIFHQLNEGPSKARNFGLEQSQGEYICFIDSDDWVHPNYLEHLLDLSTDYHADISCIKHLKTSDFTLDFPKSSLKIKEFTNLEILNQYDNVYNTYLITVWGKLYKKDLFNHIRFAEGKLHEDVDILYKLFYQAKKTVISNQVLYFYWKHANSITGRVTLNRHLDFLDVQFEKSIFLHSIGLEKQYEIQLKNLADRYLRTYMNFDVSDVESERKRFLSLSKCISSEIKLTSVGFGYWFLVKSFALSPVLANKVLFGLFNSFNVRKSELR